MDGYLSIRLKLIDLIVDRFPVDAIMAGGDDYDQRGPMMGLARWREFIKPRIKAELDYAHGKGLRFIAHMCGNVRSLLDDLIEMKLDGLESLQPEAMDVYELKRAAGKRSCMPRGFVGRAVGDVYTGPFSINVFDILRQAVRGDRSCLGAWRVATASHIFTSRFAYRLEEGIEDGIGKQMLE